MNILYYFWNENSAADIEQTFSYLGHSYVKVSYPLANYDTDETFESQLHQLLTQHHFDCIYTFNYFPILSAIADAHGIPYISWIYDCPNLTIYSHTITNACNYLFLFDRNMQKTAISLGAKHAFHMPLAVNCSRLNQQLHLSSQTNISGFSSEISFVGSMYENNMYNRVQYLPDHLRGYFDGVMQSQQKIWGYNFIEELLTDDIVNETLHYIHFENNSSYSFTAKTLLTNMLNQKITSHERIQLLNRIAESYSLDVYTGSDVHLLQNSRTHGFISYTDTMPSVFCHSKINLNITLRSITSAIPLRCLDILGARGFLLSNYQPELAEFFVPNEDFVYFESEEDLLEKIQYYLTHESERTQIAYNGWKKVQEYFSYKGQVEKIFSLVFSR